MPYDVLLRGEFVKLAKVKLLVFLETSEETKCSPLFDCTFLLRTEEHLYKFLTKKTNIKVNGLAALDIFYVLSSQSKFLLS